MGFSTGCRAVSLSTAGRDSDPFRAVGDRGGHPLGQAGYGPRPRLVRTGQPAGRADPDPLRQHGTRHTQTVGDGGRRRVSPRPRAGVRRRRRPPSPEPRTDPESANSPRPSSPAAPSARASRDTAPIALRCSTFHGGSSAQQCSSTSPEARFTHSSSIAIARTSSTRCTGQCRDPGKPAAQGSGQQGFVELHHHRSREPAGDLGPVDRDPSASDAVRSRTAPGSVIARWPLPSSSWAASVTGPGACTLTVRPGRGPPAFSHASSRASRSLPSRLAARRVTAPGRAAIRYPRTTVSMAMSTSSAPARPIMSAPIPRAGSSGR